jgi:serine/threonine-protein kinase
MESLPPAAASRQPGTQFGKFSLVARLATGGMAEIFLARLVGAAGFEKLVCIKRILPHLARDKQFVAMFFDEARIAARISHPNVCQVFELGEIDGSYYIAMEYLEGVPLACFRRHDYYGPAPEPRLVAGIAIQACEGLHHAHGLKHSDGSVMEVVHRDVSPQNLFVTADGAVKVLDFGIAKIQGATVRTSTGAIKGTYAYMAPEQLRGERVDRRTDVFALGIVMWETLTRRYLFKRETEFLTFQAITADPIPDVCAIRPDVPTALSSVILTALARNRDERFPTARMLGEAIAAAVSPLSGVAISEEIQRAFPAQLGEQAELIRVAREGGSFDLDVERGPSVGHGADLLTTPISKQSSQVVSGIGLTMGSAPKTEVSNPSMPALRRSWWPVVVAALAIALGGAGAFVYARMLQPRAPSEAAGSTPVAVGDGSAAGAAPAVVSPAAGLGSAHSAGVSAQPSAAQPAGSMSTQPAGSAAQSAGSTSTQPAGSAAQSAGSTSTQPAGTVAHAGGSTSTPPGGSSSAQPGGSSSAQPGGSISAQAGGSSSAQPGGSSSAPPNAAGTATVKSAEKHAASTTRQAAAAARPSGPPGFITIDSSPVYAVIYIDGKNFGETPLVRVELSPGRHVVHAVAPSGATRDVRIVIESGKVAPASRIVW